jgi:hypothetical protein
MAVAHAVLDAFDRQGGAWGWGSQPTLHCCCCWDCCCCCPPGSKAASLCLAAACCAACPAHAHPPPTPARPRAGLFVDVENGSEVLVLAVRRDVADLSLAHRVYDNMRATQRWAPLLAAPASAQWLEGIAAATADGSPPRTSPPLLRMGCLRLAGRVPHSRRRTLLWPPRRVPKTPAMFKYMRALAAREPDATERLIEVRLEGGLGLRGCVVPAHSPHLSKGSAKAAHVAALMRVATLRSAHTRTQPVPAADVPPSLPAVGPACPAAVHPHRIRPGPLRPHHAPEAGGLPAAAGAAGRAEGCASIGQPTSGAIGCEPQPAAPQSWHAVLCCCAALWQLTIQRWAQRKRAARGRSRLSQ